MKLRFIFLVLIFSNVLAGQNWSELMYSYEDHPSLNWDDFKGIVPSGAVYSASTNTGLAFDYQVTLKDDNVSVKFSLKCFFYPESSWKKQIADGDMDLLQHEQLHWDITELCRRNLLLALRRYKPRKSYKNDLDAIFKLGEQKRKEMQELYDQQTDHGRNKEQQRKWATKIAEELFKTSGL